LECHTWMVRQLGGMMVETALSLDDPRWAELNTRNGGAAWVPAWLRRLIAQPSDLGHFNDEWPALCSEGTTWSAAYAAMPYLVRAASEVQVSDRFDYAVVLGFIVRDRVQCDTEDSMGLRPYLAYAFHASIPSALRLASEVLSVPLRGERELRHALMAVAALQGHQLLAECIDRLDDAETCPHYAQLLAVHDQAVKSR
jgi:hypothetical protein